MDLRDANVVVTGAARGIGAALASRFHAGGANVVLADLADPAALADSLNVGSIDARSIDDGAPNRAVALVADVASEDGNVELIAAAREAFGPIDLFFANAGIANGPDLTTPEDEWNRAFDINVNAHRWAAKHLLDEWLERRRGYFCSTASAAGLLAQVGSAAYTVTKRAAVAFAEWLSITYGDRGIAVSCLCPQGVNTDMLQADLERTIGGGGADGGGAAAVVRAAGAVLEPEEVADVAAAAIEAERFLILPHPEVERYVLNKADDHERWLAGMRRLNARFAPS